MLLINNKPLEEDSVFSGGELNIRIPELGLGFSTSDTIAIDYRSTDPTGLFKLGLVISAINGNHPYAELKYSLNIPYLPYARQDRICRPGEAFSLEFAMKYLHMLGFTTITTYDIHSNVAKQIADRNGYGEFQFLEFVTTFGFSHELETAGVDTGDCTLIYPDMGASNRYYRSGLSLRNFFNSTLTTRKVRKNGLVIQELDTDPETLRDKDIFIIDDICDGGMTFIELAKLIVPSKPKSITLFVTHGIFRNGTQVLYDSGITRIITTDSLPQTDFHKGDFHVFKI